MRRVFLNNCIAFMMKVHSFSPALIQLEAVVNRIFKYESLIKSNFYDFICAQKPLNLLGLHTPTCWRTHGGVVHVVIEWLLMALRVNLCLVGSSGCLRGHLIKGNEMSRGPFFSLQLLSCHAHSFVSLARRKKGVGSVHRGWSRQKRPLFWYTC